MDALTALRERRSIRRYKSDPVPREALEAIVDCGRLAATGRGGQPWEFVVVTDRAMRGKLAEVCEFGKFLTVAPAAIVVLCRDTKYYLEDGSSATQNMLVAATALGLGSCWVAGDKKPYAEQVRRLVEAPDGYKLISIVSIGHTDEHPSPAKRPLAEVIHWGKF